MNMDAGLYLPLGRAIKIFKMDIHFWIIYYMIFSTPKSVYRPALSYVAGKNIHHGGDEPTYIMVHLSMKKPEMETSSEDFRKISS